MPFSSLWMSPYPLENCLRALIQFSVAGDWDLSGWASMGLLSHCAFLQWGGWNWGGLFLRSFPNTTSKREEKSTENNGLRSHLWDTTAVGCHLVDTDIVDLSDLGHDPILIITCGITQSWLDTVISGWTTLTYVYDFDLMTLYLLSNIRNNMTNTVPWLLWLWWNWLPPIVVPTQEFESHMPVFLSNTPSFKWFLARQDEKFNVT